MSQRKNRKAVERYDLRHSPFAQKPTQRDVARLVSETKTDLNTLATPHFKEQFLVRRTIETNGKTRELVYPEGRLRAVHERLRYHFSKIIQPSYLMSPRKGRAQRDNAIAHLNAAQYLALDLKQFYPSTTRSLIRNSLMNQFSLEPDVAGLIAHIATADDRACFGSPLTPILASLVHRPMFDRIADRCAADDLSHSVWVDDLTVSGSSITGNLRRDIRKFVSSAGLRSHKLRVYTGNRPVFITGVGVVGRNLIMPNRLEIRSKELWRDVQNAQGIDDMEYSSTRLLSHLGGLRAVVGPKSSRGQKLANEMNSIRQKRDKVRRLSMAKEMAVAEENALTIQHDDQSKLLPLPF